MSTLFSNRSVGDELFYVSDSSLLAFLNVFLSHLSNAFSVFRQATRSPVNRSSYVRSFRFAPESLAANEPNYFSGTTTVRFP